MYVLYSYIGDIQYIQQVDYNGCLYIFFRFDPGNQKQKM